MIKVTELELLLGGILGAVAIINAVALYRELNRSRERTQREIEESDGGHGSSPLQLKAQILAERDRIKREIEQERGTRVITLIHRKEPWTAPDEEPEIVLEDSETVLDQIRGTPSDRPIDFIIHTPGGVALAAELMAMAVKFHKGKVTAFVPFYAMSGGSLIALACDEIRMERYSILGPVDPQIEGYPASTYVSILKRKSQDSITDKSLILAELAEMEVRNAKEFVKWILRDKMDEPQAAQVAEVLAGGYMSHDTMITMDPAVDMGLNVVEGVPEKVYEMFRTYDFGIPKKVGRQQYA